jgi:hypothetical protein
MKQLFLIAALAINFCAYSQEDKTLTLKVSGQGKTQDEAKQNALRSAIEQAFGAFISSKTEILNDDLIKDEIVSISNGNIQKYDVVSEVQIPENGYATTLIATVSVTKLTNFCTKKGVAIEFNGGLYSINTKLDNLNSEAEVIAVENLALVCSQILSKSIDYSLETEEPKCKDNECIVNFKVIFKLNNNINLYNQYLKSTIEKLDMSDEEQKKYIENNRNLFPFVFGKMTSNGPKINDYHYLRNNKSIQILNTLLFKSSQEPYNFYITSEAGNYTIADKTAGIIDLQKSNLKNLTYGFPAATIISLETQGKITQTSWGKDGLKSSISPKMGILILPINTNSELGYITLQKKITLSEIGKISKFEILPISND